MKKKMNLLWQKESDASYFDIFKNIPTLFPELYKASEKFKSVNSCGNKENHRKCNQVALKLQNKADEELKKKKWHKAMNFYNESLKYAENNSENVCLAYAHRSLCFFHLELYEKCLVDINLATLTNRSEYLINELAKRRQMCLEQLTKDDDQRDFAQKLSHESDENFPGLANVLKIVSDEKYGRHIIAKCDIKVGKIILLEEAFASQAVKEKPNEITCETCSRNWMNFIACKNCSAALFCSYDCAEKNELHRIECQNNSLNVYTDIKNDVQSILFGIQIFPNIERLIEFVESIIKDNSCKVPETTNDMKSKYSAFLNLHILSSMKEDVDLLAEAYIIYRTLLKSDLIQTKFDTEKKRIFLKHLILHTRCVLLSNGFECNNRKSTFTILSYINHACIPNVLYAVDGNQARCVTVKPIKEGQQLFISYIIGLPQELKSNDFGRKYISRTFGFECECVKCKSNCWPIHSDRLLKHPIYTLLIDETNKLRTQNADETLCGESHRKKLITLQRKCMSLLEFSINDDWSVELEQFMNAFNTLLNF